MARRPNYRRYRPRPGDGKSLRQKHIEQYGTQGPESFLGRISEYERILTNMGKSQEAQNTYDDYEPYDYASEDYEDTTVANATEEDVKTLMQDNNVIVDSSLIGRGDQFSKLFSPIYIFTQVKPNYGSGPLKSTRVSVHQYIPDSWDDVYAAIRDALSIKQSGDIGTSWASSVTGSVYIEWQVPWKEFAGTRYDGIDLLDYINFSLSTSKGRYVKSWEQFDYENVGALPF